MATTGVGLPKVRAELPRICDVVCAATEKTVDRHLAAFMLDGVVGRLYEKWFQQPIPPGNLRMDLPMTFALRDQLRWPTDRVGDEISK